MKTRFATVQVVSLLALAALSAACGDDASSSTASSTTTASSSSSGGDGGSGVGGEGGEGGAVPVGGAGPCNSVVNDGPVVPVIAIDVDVPPGEGGEIAEGEYTLVQVDWNTGPGGYTGPHFNGSDVQASLRVDGIEMEIAYRITANGGYEDDAAANANISTQGTELMFAWTCFSCVASHAPCETPPTQLSYTASPTTLLFMFPENVWTFTREP
jgi:hypothetical protein